MYNDKYINENKIKQTIKSLKSNGFEVWFVSDQQEAKEVFFENILSQLKPKTISWGDSLTLHSTNILDKIRLINSIKLIETFGEHLSWRERINKRKEALLCDLFLTGTNALTINGQLINLDMIGNRIAGITFGPKNVIIFVGTNKIVENIDEGIKRIKEIAAPLNAKRHKNLNTPCQQLGKCINCNVTDRICNSWLITEKSYPVGRIKIILINKDLGY